MKGINTLGQPQEVATFLVNIGKNGPVSIPKTPYTVRRKEKS